MSDLATSADRFAAARAVADATLYEGYVLYPYRASAAKNRVRWQFGVLAPRSWAEADGSERWHLRTACLVDPGRAPLLTVRVRFLQVQRRTIEAVGPGGFVPVDSLEVRGIHWVPWDEAVERVVDVGARPLAPIERAHHEATFAFGGGSSAEDLLDDREAVVGRVVRRWDDVAGSVTVDAAWAPGDGGLLRATVRVANTSRWSGDGADRDQALVRSLLGVHTLLAVDGGRFVSLLDPPPAVGDAVRACDNDGTFPVLVADPSGGGDVVLSSPITLYDHPAVAPESQGDLYDATEIDEILALRVLTLTDREKAEARGTDARSAAIVDRCDAMAPEAWERLHGTMRDIGPIGAPPEARSDAIGAAPADGEVDATVAWWDPAVDAEVDPWSDHVRIGEVEVAKGTRVVLRPSRRSDAQDLFLAGMAATVAGVFSDVDGTQQVAVTVDDDPATEALAWQGRYLFFFPDEIEVAP